jgi:16S rRNA (uracil1498-N3)-methyltransferase
MQLCEYDCVLESFSDVVTARIAETRKINTEPAYRAHLYQALPKGEKFDIIIQKAVECGVYDITPFESGRCIVQVKPEAEAGKTERRQRIALEAAKQCGRGIIPEVKPTLDFDSMLREAKKSNLVLFCYEGDGTIPLRQILSQRKNTETIREIAVIIGSEGGFSLDEAEKAVKSGAIPAGLGKRILRTETAGSFILSCLVYEFEL